jgi:hypothetical protein
VTERDHIEAVAICLTDGTYDAARLLHSASSPRTPPQVDGCEERGSSLKYDKSARPAHIGHRFEVSEGRELSSDRLPHPQCLPSQIFIKNCVNHSPHQSRAVFSKEIFNTREHSPCRNSSPACRTARGRCHE